MVVMDITGEIWRSLNKQIPNCAKYHTNISHQIHPSVRHQTGAEQLEIKLEKDLKMNLFCPVGHI